MLSTLEKEFALNTINNGQRFDKRDSTKRRPIKFTFESELGCCLLDIGKTKVMAQISWDITAPKDSRPNDGILKCNVELSMIAHPRFEMSSTRHNASAQLSRFLEKCISESRCLDLESLCLEAGLKVMRIRVDVHALNDDGNLIGAMCLAAIAALCHFKRPDISFCGGEATIHTFAEKDPLSLTVLHIPVCSNFVLVKGHLLIDPTIMEQRICEASITVACNKFREICLLQVSGETVLSPAQVLRCVKLATVEADEISEILRKALDHDAKERRLGQTTSTYPHKINNPLSDPEMGNIVGKQAENLPELMDEVCVSSSEEMETNTEEVKDLTEPRIKILHDDVIQVGLGGDSKWNNNKLSKNNRTDILTVNKSEECIKSASCEISKKKNKKKKFHIKNTKNLNDSEEETVVLVGGDHDDDKIDLSVALKKPSKLKNKKNNKYF